jgi:asparagine synthase (glutamine-hydrolysing)
MCGIAGSLRWDGFDDTAAVQAMTDALRHRGPDAGGVVKRGPMVLGHRRLSIIDLDPSANQPMTDGDVDAWIVFNGEIYNYQDLRRELESEGLRFRTRSDTEVLLKGYLQWGAACLSKLNGMYAFAIWEERRQRLTLARDRLGKKPLYYRLDGNAIAFASELPALRHHSAVSDQLNPDAIGHYLSLNYTLTEACILRDVSKLPPGHVLTVERDRSPVLRRYWDLASCFRQKRNFASVGAAADELRALIDDAVRLRLVSDVPLGAFLSGGIDSAAVVAAMKAGAPGGTIKTFTASFDIEGFDETVEAGEAARFLSAEHHASKLHVDLEQGLQAAVAATGEPFADTSMIPMLSLAGFTREMVTVSLSGDGGDELFAGYTTYTADRLRQLTSWAPAWSSRGLFAALDPLLPAGFGKVSFEYKLRQFLRGHALPADRAHSFWREIFSEEEKARILGRRVEPGGSADPWSHFAAHAEAVTGCHLLDRAMYVDIKTWLVDDILVKVDRTTMAHGLEARAPLLDFRLVEFAASLPVSFKLRGFDKKYLLKRSQQGRLPPATVNRRKAGFNAPVSHWLNGPLAHITEAATLGPKMADLFDLTAIRRLWGEHRARRRDHGLKLFGLACLGLWLEQSPAK